MLRFDAAARYQFCAVARSLDLDDPRAEVGEETGAVRAGENPREVEHGHTGEKVSVRRHRREHSMTIDAVSDPGDDVRVAAIVDTDPATAEKLRRDENLPVFSSPEACLEACRALA